jgi:hypothetical protein
MASRIGRQFLAALGNAAAWPLAVRARPVIGLLNGVSFAGAFAPYAGRVLKGAKSTDLPVLLRPVSSSPSISKSPRRSASRCRRP